VTRVGIVMYDLETRDVYHEPGNSFWQVEPTTPTVAGTAAFSGATGHDVRPPNPRGKKLNLPDHHIITPEPPNLPPCP
jgi:hypothetical protein